MADGVGRESGWLEHRLPGGQDLDWKPYVYILPIVLIYLTLVLYPVAYSIWMSFTDFTTVTQVEWIGLENYITVLSDGRFWNALVNSAVYSLGTVISIALGLLLALILNSEEIRGKTIFQSIIFLPYVLPIVVASVLFSWIFTEFGIVNSFLMQTGLIQNPIGWLSSPTLAMPTIIIVTVWKSVGFNMLIFLAGLQSIPSNVYEAARIAGKSRWQTFHHITLPLLQAPLVITTILGLIGAIRGFDTIWIMTQGGPGNATETLGVYFYRAAFASGDFSSAAAIGVIMFMISIALSGAVFWYSRT